MIKWTSSTETMRFVMIHEPVLELFDVSAANSSQIRL